MIGPTKIFKTCLLLVNAEIFYYNLLRVCLIGSAIRVYSILLFVAHDVCIFE